MRDTLNLNFPRYDLVCKLWLCVNIAKQISALGIQILNSLRRKHTISSLVLVFKEDELSSNNK